MPSTLEFKTGEELDLYRKHAIHYLDIEIPNKMLSLSEKDRDRAMQMLNDYADVLEQLFVPGMDILEHIQGKRFAAAKENPHPGIDFEYDCPIIKAYDEWKARKEALRKAGNGIT